MRTYRHRLVSARRLSPRAVRIGLIVFGLIVLLDLITARFSAQVQSALTLPHVTFSNSGFHAPFMKPAATTGASSTGKTGTATTPVATTAPATDTTIPALPANVPARDSFPRPNH